MKNLYTLLILAFATLSLNATVITSAANGNATNPFTWNCTCIPMDGDTIIINHAITLDVDYAFTMGGIQVNASGSITGNANNRIFGVSGGYFINNGTVTVGYFIHNGGTVTNNGYITALGSILLDQTVTTVNNGTMNAGDSTYVNTNATLQNNNILDAGVCLSAGTINNVGTMNSLDMGNTGTFTHSASGNLTINGSLYNTGNVTLSGTTHITGDIWNAENMTANYFVTAQTLYNGDTISGTAFFTNNGTVSLSNSLYNSENIQGTGDFCVADSSLNSGAITGSVDICDQTGGGWDMNIGSEAGTVTHCASGPCSIGISETPSVRMSIVPNPVHELLNITLSESQNGIVRVTDVTGRVVQEQQMNGNSVVLNVIALPNGIYSVTVIGNEQVSTSRFVKD